jgi:hypothetical protein
MEARRVTAVRPLPFPARPADRRRRLAIVRTPGETLRPEIKLIIEALAREAVASECADRDQQTEDG